MGIPKLWRLDAFRVDAEAERKLLAIATLREAQERQSFVSGLAVREHVLKGDRRIAH